METRIRSSQNPMIVAIPDVHEDFEYVVDQLAKLSPIGPRLLVRTTPDGEKPRYLGGCGYRFERLARTIRNLIKPKLINVFGAYLWYIGENKVGCVGETFNALKREFSNSVEVKVLDDLCCG